MENEAIFTTTEVVKAEEFLAKPLTVQYDWLNGVKHTRCLAVGVFFYVTEWDDKDFRRSQ